MIACSDASFASEEAMVGEKKEPHMSQKGRMCLLSSSECLTAEEFPIHLMSHGSTVIRRVCRSTMAAETYALQASVEETMRVRATITEMQGR